jgi:formylglycine-generating enzyme required for sulfatase activity
MKKLLFIATLLLAAFLAACGPPPQAGGGDTGGAQGATTPEGPANTPTPVVLATPTPKAAPPTPTPKPSPTVAPIESTTEEATSEAEGEATSEAAAATSEPVAAPIPEDMVAIAAGPFTMGQDGSKPKNGPAHEVDLPAYEIDRFEVTNDEFARFVQETSYKTYAEQNSSKNWQDVAEGKGNHPVVYVTWDDAKAYCEWAGKRLPTEAEWEKAARGDDGRLYPWGNDFVPANGNFYEGGIRGTTAVGSFASGASASGVEDLAGNVREWTADDFVAYPGAAADADPFFGTENKVNRGGGWFDGEDGELVTTYNRNAGPPGTSANDDIGFRCARDAQ